MRDGAVILVKGDPKEKGLMGLLGRVIVWRTKSDKTDVIKFVRGFYYDDTIYLRWKWGFIPVLKSGVRVRSSIDEKDSEIRDLKEPYNDLDSWAVSRWCSWYAKRDYHYNVVQLIAFLAIYPTRKIWEAIHVIPFGSAIDLVCSTFAAMADEVVGRSVLSDVDPTLIVPGDFDKSPIYGPEVV